MKKTLILTAAVMALISCNGTDNIPTWERAGDRIATAWAEEVSPANILPEYPRPQMERTQWQSLNGLWEYAVTAADAPQPAEFEGHILVPFPLESSLSGVGRSLSPEEALWYRTEFKLPSSWRKHRTLLNFGAVDWAAEVWVNGHLAGTHTGGYTAFSIDITDFLVKGRQSLTVKVLDGTDNDTQPRGKQVSKPRGIWYTSVSGIWQSVWLEPVGQTRITNYYASGHPETGVMTLSVEAEGFGEGITLQAELAGDFGSEGKFNATDIVAGSIAEGTGLALRVENPRAWSPDDPYLYGLRLRLLKGGKTVDEVTGYAAFRSISVATDEAGHNRMAINGEPLFQLGPLDQGWWPDGLYTAPSDDALKFDIEETKELGFNMIRKHIKVEPQRWYYWCDRLGILIWQDMPCITDSRYNKWNTIEIDGGTFWDAPQSARDTYYKEWGEIISQLKGHPSIVVWVPFNEAWAQFETAKAVAFTKSADPTRLVNPASGGNFVSGVGDILDNHHYPNPAMPVHDPSMVEVLGEYGGIGLPVEGHLWQPDRNWGYVQFKSGEEVLSEYTRFADELIKLIGEGCSAAVYTQTTDVEGEVNGLMTYDRKVVKMDAGKLRSVNEEIIRSM